ncbi:PIG-L family deacetylase [Microbacterium sp. 1P10UB]|uniref:PIG-L deacetylase family protein n=1 Tax=unclassified Microbacterium TaxID=2609290 RepID=UPI0039A36090
MRRSANRRRPRAGALLGVAALLLATFAAVPATASERGADAAASASSTSGAPLPTARMRDADPLGGSCFGAPTTMSIWAHYDDDLLFAGSRLDDAIQAGGCVRTVFLTGGDAGKGPGYAAGREQGIMRAYNVMRGVKSEWTSTDVTLDTGAKVVAWRPTDDDRVTLVFFRLPDGNLGGQGFPTTGDVSLLKLANGVISSMKSLSGSYALTWPQIVDSLDGLIHRFTPATILTSVPGDSKKWSAGDHADHQMVGNATREAWEKAGFPVDLVSYAIGYQSENFAPNVGGDALVRKIDAFSAYAHGDSVVDKCENYQSCLAVPRFGAWLQRQYARTDAGLFTDDGP